MKRDFHIVEQRVRLALESAGRPRGLLAAVSGGADSVAMFRALVAAGEKPVVVTCNFGLRGERADADCRFVEQLCHKFDVECITLKLPAAEYARREKVSVEMACREMRYAEFRRIMKQRGLERIVVAHNQDDNVETLFLNLMRGAGIKGLRGMGEDNGEILRPLISSARHEIEDYLLALGQEWVTDHTNLEDEYSRNYLRLNVLPILEKRWPGYRNAVARTQRNLRADEQIIDSVLSSVRTDFLALEEMQKYGLTAIHAFCREHGANATQAREMFTHFRSYEKGRRWATESGTIFADTDGLRFVSEEPCGEPEYRCEKIEITAQTMDEIRHNPRKDIVYLPEPITAYRWRLPRKGDRVKLLGMKGSRLVSDILKESGLSYDARRRVHLLVDAHTDDIIWVEGLRRARLHLIDPASQSAYRLSARPPL